MKVEFKKIYLKKRFPLVISRGEITGSENLFVFVEKNSVAGNNVVGLGEMAPCDGQTAEQGEQGLRQLLTDDLSALSIHEIYARGREMAVLPSALAALDMALWDNLAKQASKPLYQFFWDPKKS